LFLSHNHIISTYPTPTTSKINMLVKPKPSTPQPIANKKSNKTHNPKEVLYKKPTTTQNKKISTNAKQMQFYIGISKLKMII
jgi:hypothetical protein